MNKKKIFLIIILIIIIIMIISIVGIKIISTNPQNNQKQETAIFKIYDEYLKTSVEVYTDGEFTGKNREFGGEYIIIDKDKLTDCYYPNGSKEEYCSTFEYQLKGNKMLFSNDSGQFNGEYTYRLVQDTLILTKKIDNMEIILYFQKING